MYTISVLLPGLNSLTLGLFGRKLGKNGSSLISIILLFSSIILCFFECYEVILNQSLCQIQFFNWLSSDQLSIHFGFYFDSLTIIIITVVISISSFIHIYSIWYISDDPHFQKFLCYISGFTFFILILVSGNSYLIIFLGWEFIGVISFLLINFWSTRIPANTSAIQAFTINRVGDISLTIGFFICLWAYSNLDFITIFSISPYINETIQNFIGFAFLIGCMGKSAQLGLSFWLVYSMEGPTPVSSILHAATLVTAGIYLLLRSSYILEYASLTLVWILWIGALTTIAAALIGLLQNDIKRCIAYSTISQLGYIIIAIGVSQYSTALFHLSSHAFFKGLLFLGAGAVVHSINDEQDLRKYGGLIKFIPVTYISILVGSLSLIAIYPLSGFFSKDFILELLSASYDYNSSFGYFIGTLTAGLTAFYSIRLIYLTFYGYANAPFQSYLNVHEVPWLALIPFVVLIILSIFYGFIVKDVLSGLGSDAIGSSFFIHPIKQNVMVDAEFQSLIWKLIPIIISLSSVSLATYLYLYSPNLIIQLKLNYPNWYKFFNQKLYLDVLYSYFIYLGLNLSYQLTQTIDRGSLEILGSKGVSQQLTQSSQLITRLDVGDLTIYANYMLMSALSLTFLTLFLYH